jgi:hypothetical protein
MSKQGNQSAGSISVFFPGTLATKLDFIALKRAIKEHYCIIIFARFSPLTKNQLERFLLLLNALHIVSLCWLTLFCTCGKPHFKFKSYFSVTDPA